MNTKIIEQELRPLMTQERQTMALQVERNGVMKKVAAVIAETGELFDLEIGPGTTCRDVLARMGKEGTHIVSVGKGADTLSSDDNVYQAVQDGGKLYIATPVEVGGD